MALATSWTKNLVITYLGLWLWWKLPWWGKSVSLTGGDRQYCDTRVFFALISALPWQNSAITLTLRKAPCFFWNWESLLVAFCKILCHYSHKHDPWDHVSVIYMYWLCPKLTVMIFIWFGELELTSAIKWLMNDTSQSWNHQIFY